MYIKIIGLPLRVYKGIKFNCEVGNEANGAASEVRKETISL